MWHVLLETWTELRKLMQEEEIHNLPDMYKDGWKCLTPRFPDVMDFPRCNNADNDWYMRMPTDPPPVDPKVYMLPEL